MILKVEYNSKLLAIIISVLYQKSGITFFTPHALSQQVAYMQHPKGYCIMPHVHNLIMREVHYTNEVLVLRKGKLRVDFYTREQEYIESHIIGAGDVILLIDGGHGFYVLEDVEMFEIKQGPYAGENDKTRFSMAKSENIHIIGIQSEVRSE